MKHTPPESSGPLTLIGWRETISLPELKLHDFAVKVDTGAKTTALHVDAIETFQKDRANWVRFQSPELGDVPVSNISSAQHYQYQRHARGPYRDPHAD